MVVLDDISEYYHIHMYMQHIKLYMYFYITLCGPSTQKEHVCGITGLH